MVDSSLFPQCIGYVRIGSTIGQFVVARGQVKASWLNGFEIAAGSAQNTSNRTLPNVGQLGCWVQSLCQYNGRIVLCVWPHPESMIHSVLRAHKSNDLQT